MAGLPKEITYTKVPNFILEYLMTELTGSELKVTLAICRKTYGFQQQADRIPLSQIRELTGLGKNTIIKAIRQLVDKKIINKNTAVVPHKYRIIIPNKGSKNAPYSSIIEPPMDQKVNPIQVQKVNTQKKPINKAEINTTSIDVSDDVIDIAQFWKELFHTKINLSNKEIVYAIQKRIYSFGVDNIKKAMINRSKSPYYKEQKPYLRSSATAFFPYPDTINNDLHRESNNLLTYDERNDRICKGLNVDEDFEMVPDQRDKQGRSKWKCKLT